MKKVLTRIKSAATGEEYYIGTRGDAEVVSVQLQTDTTVDWTKYKVVVRVESSSGSYSLTPDSNGQCTFTVEHGLYYNVTIPQIDGYQEIPAATNRYQSVLSSRAIFRYYQKVQSTESLEVVFSVYDANGQVTMNSINGLSVIVQAIKDGENYTYTKTISSGKVLFDIPQDATYTVIIPTIAGVYTNYNNSTTYTAGNSIRHIQVTYLGYTIGFISALDSDGNSYVIGDNGLWVDVNTGTTELSTEEAKTKIAAIVFNPPELQSASRNDGRVGCGFMIKPTIDSFSAVWAPENVSFLYDAETNPNGSEALPYITSEATAANYLDGVYYTSEIIRVAPMVCKTSQGMGYNFGNIAAAQCRNKSVIINGVPHQGFLMSFRQMRLLQRNQAFVNLAIKACGISKSINLSSGYWYSSQQYSIRKATVIALGDFMDQAGWTKYNALGVIPVYDI